MKVILLLCTKQSFVLATVRKKPFEKLEENAGQQHVLLFPQCFLFNPLPHIPILGLSNSAANKDRMSKIGTNGDTVM